MTYPARTYDASGGALAEFQKPSYDHRHFVLSPDGSRMALSGRHMEKVASAKGDAQAKVKRDASGKPIVIANLLEVVDVASGRSLVSFKPPMLFDNLALSPDNQFLAVETSQRAGIVNVLHLASRKSKELKTGQRRIPPGGIVFSSDSRSINIVLPDRLLTIAIGSGEIKEFKYESASPAVSFSPTTNMVAVGVSRSRRGRPEVQIYDVAQGKPLEELEVPTGPNRVEFSTDGRYLAATIAGGVVRLWQTSDWTSLGSVAGQLTFDPGQLAVSSDGQLVAVCSRGTGNQEMKVINITGGDTVQSIRTSEMSFLPSGLLAVADDTGPFYLNTGSGSLTELPGGDAALAQAGDSQLQAGEAAMQSRYATPPAGQTGYGQVPAPQQNAQVGYGQVGADQSSALPPEYASRYGQSPQQPAGSQPGYGQVGSDQGAQLPPEYASRYSQATPQPQNEQPGYGQVTAQPPPDQPGYGQIPSAQPPSDQPGYGRVPTPQAPSDQPGYGQGTAQPASGQVTTIPDDIKPFLDDKKQVPARLEWNREITTRRGGTVLFRVTSPGPFAVTVVTDRTYRALTSRDRKSMRKEDVLLTLNAKGPTYEGKVTVPAGSSWFIIENQTDGEVEFQLQCFAGKPTSSPPEATSNGTNAPASSDSPPQPQSSSSYGR